MHNLLTPEELSKLAGIKKISGWHILVDLINKHYQIALEDMSRFKSSDEAYEKRGRVEGIRRILSELHNINNPISEGAEHASGRAGNPADRYDYAGDFRDSSIDYSKY